MDNPATDHVFKVIKEGIRELELRFTNPLRHSLAWIWPVKLRAT